MLAVVNVGVKLGVCLFGVTWRRMEVVRSSR